MGRSKTLELNVSEHVTLSVLFDPQYGSAVECLLCCFLYGNGWTKTFTRNECVPANLAILRPNGQH
jgi:hypothetical protein